MTKKIHPPARGRICIYGKSIAEALQGDVVGGAELQGSLLAQALARAGMTVTVLDPAAKSDWVTPDGIRVRVIPGWDRGFRGLRMVTHRIPGLIRASLSARPTTFYVRGFSFLFVVLLMLTRLTRAKFVLALASDLDVSGFWPRYFSFYRRNSSVWDYVSSIIPNHLASNIVLKFSDVVLVQHKDQTALIRRPVVELSNIVSDDVFEVPPVPRGDHALLVGLLAAQKGLREFLSVIRRLPEITFEFVGAPSGQDGPNIEEQLRQCPNVVLCGRLRRVETLQRIAAAKVLLNVSPAEGFPNTFLEAWALGTPVLSLTVDPGGVIAAHGLGLACGGDEEKFIEALRSGSYQVDPLRLCNYVRTYHSMAMAARFFAAIDRNEIAARKAPGTQS